MRKIIVVSDPEFEVGFKVLNEYCKSVQTIFDPNEVIVIPIWPSGKVEIIDCDDNKSMELIFKTVKELEKEYKGELKKNEVHGQ